MKPFFPPAEPQTLGTVADAVGAEVAAEHRERIMTDVMTLDAAGPEHISFLRSAKFRAQLKTTNAGAIFCDPRLADDLPEGCVALKTPYAGNAFGLASALFHPSAMRPRPMTQRDGGEIAPTAIVEEPDLLEANVIVEAHAVIARGVEIGRGSVIGPGVVIGPNCTIGRNSFIGAGSTIQCTRMGDRVILHPGVRIGQDGFGLAKAPTGMRKVPQVGSVIIQDDVELGANTTVDRGSRRDTIIGKGCKIDNQVQIGHNTVIGTHCVIAGCTGVSGSVTIGNFVTIGGNVGIRDGLTIGDGAEIAGAAQLGVDVPAGAQFAGYPATHAKQYVAERWAITRMLRRERNASNS